MEKYLLTYFADYYDGIKCYMKIRNELYNDTDKTYNIYKINNESSFDEIILLLKSNDLNRRKIILCNSLGNINIPNVG